MVGSTMRRISHLVMTLAVLSTLALGFQTSEASARTDVLPDATREAIVGVLEAFAALELAGKDDVPTKQDYAVVQKACRAVPQTSALLRSQQSLCTATLKLHGEVDRDCDPRRSCPRLFARSAAAAKRVNTLMVSANRVIDRDVPAGRCRATLRSSASDLQFGRTIEQIFRNMDRAIRVDDDQAYERALLRFLRLTSRRGSPYADEIKAVSAHC